MDNPPTRKEHGVPVVYRIINRLNGKIYVGSAKNFYNRFGDYKRCNRNVSPIIKAAILKHGFSNFSFDILEVVADVSSTLLREQIYLDSLQPFVPHGYNFSRYASSWLGNKHTEETKKKIALINKGRVRSRAMKENLREINLNRDPEIQKKMTESIRKTFASGTRKQISYKIILQIDKKTLQVIERFNSIPKAASSINGNAHTIWAAAVGKAHGAHGFYWRYEEEYKREGLVLRNRGDLQK